MKMTIPQKRKGQAEAAQPQNNILPIQPPKVNRPENVKPQSNKCKSKGIELPRPALYLQPPGGGPNHSLGFGNSSSLFHRNRLSSTTNLPVATPLLGPAKLTLFRPVPLALALTLLVRVKLLSRRTGTLLGGAEGGGGGGGADGDNCNIEGDDGELVACFAAWRAKLGTGGGVEGATVGGGGGGGCPGVLEGGATGIRDPDVGGVGGGTIDIMDDLVGEGGGRDNKLETDRRGLEV